MPYVGRACDERRQFVSSDEGGNTIRLRLDDGTDETPPLSIKGNEITGMLSGTMITFRRVGGSS